MSEPAWLNLSLPPLPTRLLGGRTHMVVGETVDGFQICVPWHRRNERWSDVAVLAAPPEEAS